MRYAVVSADYGEPSIRDEYTGEGMPWTNGEVSADLALRINVWNQAYQSIIPLNAEMRSTVGDLIEALDRVGLALTGELELELGEGSKARYYSEGKGVQ